MVATKDYYKSLGIERDATPAQVKAAFRRLAREFHPDTNKGNPQAEVRFKEISEAYDVLSDAKKKAEYDQPVSRQGFHPSGYGAGAGPAGAQGFSDVEFDLSEMFGDRFGGMFNRGRRPQTQPPAPPETPVEISLDEAIHGCRRLVTPAQGKAFEITIPPGVTNGSKVRAAQQTLVVTVRHDPAWRVDNRDLHGEVEVPDHIAVLGGEVEATTPTGRISGLKIAPGTGAGKVLRLRGKGIPGLKNGAGGDLLLRVRVEIPTTPTDAERSAYETLRDLRSGD